MADFNYQNRAAWPKPTLGEGMPLSYLERRIYHFRESVDRVISIKNIPEHLRVAPPELLLDAASSPALRGPFPGGGRW